MTNKTNHFRGVRRAAALMVVGVAAGITGACDFLDPTNVENPRTTDEDLAQAQNPTLALLPGLQAQFSRMIHSTIVLTENVSDNYTIIGTGLDNTYDVPSRIRPVTVNSTSSATGAYWNAQELRALADFVIDEIIPADENAPAAAVAEARYYRGMALLSLGENFVGAPLEPEGPVLEPDSLLRAARTDLVAATAGEGAAATAAKAALARLHRWLGEGAQAASYAEDALADDPSLLFVAEADAASVSNAPWAFLISRALREMQPLPRLDFLDPKYLTNEADVPVAKAEEMHLILAEVHMADGAWLAGAEELATAIEVAQSRPITLFNDPDSRAMPAGAGVAIRPRDEEIVIRSDADAQFRSALVFERPGTIPAATISNTSLDADSIRALGATAVALPADQERLLHALYLARQEILFLEGRRMADLGIRLPVMLREIEVNTTLDLGDFGTEVHVPAWIPPEQQLDEYSPLSPYPEGTAAADDVEPSTLEVTIRHDMNRILVENRSAALPLF